MQTKAILIIDQEEVVRESLCLVLTEEGFHCFVSSNREDALAILNKHSIGLVTIDSQLLKSSELLEAITEEYPDVKIIIMSSYTEIEITQQALILGADDFILKPIDFEELIDKLSTHLSFSSK